MRESAAVVVVGGGVIGSSVAVRLRQRLRGARVVVVERDPTYARASSRLATGGIRQQYESPLNVAMARYGTSFYRRFDELTTQMRSVFTRVDELATSPSKGADETLTTVRRALAQTVRAPRPRS